MAADARGVAPASRAEFVVAADVAKRMRGSKQDKRFFYAAPNARKRAVFLRFLFKFCSEDDFEVRRHNSDEIEVTKKGLRFTCEAQCRYELMRGIICDVLYVSQYAERDIFDNNVIPALSMGKEAYIVVVTAGGDIDIVDAEAYLKATASRDGKMETNA
jgi:hypothetical protein